MNPPRQRFEVEVRTGSGSLSGLADELRRAADDLEIRDSETDWLVVGSHRMTADSYRANLAKWADERRVQRSERVKPHEKPAEAPVTAGDAGDGRGHGRDDESGRGAGL